MSSSSLVLGGGCFWCLDAAYRLVPGVVQVTCGYAGGSKPNPTYEEVCAHQTGHAEVIKIEYDPAKVSRERILELFWEVHDPTQVGGQGNDQGEQYRSVIYTTSEEDRQAAEASRTAAQVRFRRPISTEIAPLAVFWPAEEYHQNYFNRNPGRGYCVMVIRPKIEHIKETLQTPAS